jgi:comEA protein
MDLLKSVREAHSMLRGMLGITRSEYLLSIILLSGAAAGLLLEYVEKGVIGQAGQRQQIYHIIDSLAAAHSTTFVGITDSGTAIPALAAGDTIVQKVSAFPVRKVKAPPAGKKININTALRTELMNLPGVGESTADKILQYRKQNPFKSIEDLMQVKGIGPKKFEKIRPYIVTGSRRESS